MGKSTLENLFESAETESTIDVESLLEENNQLKEKNLYNLAEIENIRRHSREKILSAKEEANISLISQLLPILDDFEKAEEHNEVTDGISIIIRKLKGALASVGLEKMNVESQAFDVDFHEAVAVVAAPGIDKGTIIQNVRDGYTLNGKVIRHAQVVVSNGEG